MTKQITRLDHLNLTVSSFQETITWYSEVFTFEVVEEGLTDEGRPWGILRSGDCMLCVYEYPNLKPVSENADFPDHFHHLFHFGLRITDREKWEQVLISKKIQPHYGGAVSYPHSTSWYIKDPSGHMIEVVLWKHDEVKFD
jgi:catechol 2,3-dioxygenase-like lactoylglutathione lyase family enzyme